MKKYLLIFILLLACTGLASAETWTPVGQVDWTEGMLTGWSLSRGKIYNKTWKVSVERSVERPGVFRLQPYAENPIEQEDDVYAILHTENPDKIYFEYFAYNYTYLSYPVYYHIFQRCPENGTNSEYYGRFTSENTIEFPKDAFCVESLKSNTNAGFPSPNDNVEYSKCAHIIVFPDGALDYSYEPENWHELGKAYWEDPFWAVNDGEPLCGTVKMEKSLLNPDKYRFQITSSDYITIHLDTSNKVYVEPYTLQASGGSINTVTQMCPENGIDENCYGQLIDGRVEMPGSYFSVYLGLNGKTVRLGDDRRCLITFPDNFDYPLQGDSSVYMGIIGFSDELTIKPFSHLNQYRKNDFTTFVDNLPTGNASLLYYAVDKFFTNLLLSFLPDNLSKVALITFTDGLDQGSLDKRPSRDTPRKYASYLAGKIAETTKNGHPLEAYAIGLKGADVDDDELFSYNLQSLASSEENISLVNNIAELQQKLNTLSDNLSSHTTQRLVQIKVPMMTHGDKYRFTLDHTGDKAENSGIWFEGVFNGDKLSLDNIVYHGFTTFNGVSVRAKKEGTDLLFSFAECRTPDGYILDVDKDGIDQWQFIASGNTWKHNIENAKAEDIVIKDIRSSVAIMLVLDCSASLGDLFPSVQTAANSFISRMAGDSSAGVDDILIDPAERLSTTDPDVEIYNLQGIRVENPGPGLYILRKGNQTQKVVVR